MSKNDHVHEGGKVGRSYATPTKFFSVDSYDLKIMSFKFGNDIFITFEMPGVAYSRPVDKIHISLQFRPSVIRGPWLGTNYTRQPVGKNRFVLPGNFD
jgi:hypothetical protein